MTASNVHAAFWQADNVAQRGVDVDTGYTYSGDDAGLRYFLNQVPNELSGQSLQIDLPMPDGTLATYEIFESSIMQPGLAAKFPQIRSFVVRGVDYPGSTGRVDISEKGFRGMIYTPFGRVFIDQLRDASSRYVSKTSGSNTTGNRFRCGVAEMEQNRVQFKSYRPVFTRPLARTSGSMVSNRIPGSMLAYRLAVSATPEYVAEVSTATPSVNDAMAEINTAINRVNQIYGRDLGIRLTLVDGNELLIDINNEAGFTNDSPIDLLSENQLWTDRRIGPSNYDVGHVFSTGPGGIASVQAVCEADKAQGVSGLTNPTGDTFYIDFIAHEIGHQFGANHTFNGSTGSCAGTNRNAATAFEPGSGSTIMSYAGICFDNQGDENLQTNSDATFHAGTIAEINEFVSNGNTGGSCASPLALTQANNDPTGVNAGADKIIPAGTPFRLSGSASDPDGDVLSYQWDQMDAGETATTGSTFNTDLGDNPLFRSYVPQSTPDRYFPSLDGQIDPVNVVVGEIIPVVARDLNFRLTVRDCKSGQAADDIKITVDGASGPFKILSPNKAMTFVATNPPPITWDPANTNTSPVNCASVDIDLLTFSADKSTYAVTNVALDLPNNGFATIGPLDDASNAQARFRVSCRDNVFYDISDADLNITGAIAFPTTGNTTAMSSAGICGEIDVIGTPTGGSATSDSGGGSMEWLFLWFLSAFTAAKYYRRPRFRGYTGS